MAEVTSLVQESKPESQGIYNSILAFRSFTMAPALQLAGVSAANTGCSTGIHAKWKSL